MEVISSRDDTGRIWFTLALIKVDPDDNHAVVPSIKMSRTGPVQLPFILPGLTRCRQTITN
jgi:hypothetical protein